MAVNIGEAVCVALLPDLLDPGLLLDLLQADGDRGLGVDVVNLLAATRNIVTTL